MDKYWMIFLLLMFSLTGNAVALEGGRQSGEDNPGPGKTIRQNQDRDVAAVNPDRDKVIAEQLEMLKMMDMLEHFDLIRDMETIEGEDEQ